MNKIFENLMIIENKIASPHCCLFLPQSSLFVFIAQYFEFWLRQWFSVNVY